MSLSTQRRGLTSSMYLVHRSFVPAALRSERETLYGTELCQWPNALEAKEPYLGWRSFLGAKKQRQLAAKDFKSTSTSPEKQITFVVGFWPSGYTRPWRLSGAVFEFRKRLLHSEHMLQLWIVLHFSKTRRKQHDKEGLVKKHSENGKLWLR